MSREKENNISEDGFPKKHDSVLGNKSSEKAITLEGKSGVISSEFEVTRSETSNTWITVEALPAAQYLLPHISVARRHGET